MGLTKTDEEWSEALGGSCPGWPLLISSDLEPVGYLISHVESQ